MIWTNKIIFFSALLLAATATALQESSEIVKTSLELTNGEDQHSPPTYSTDNPTTRTQQSLSSSSIQETKGPLYTSPTDSNIRPSLSSADYKSWQSPSTSSQLYAKNGIPINDVVIPKESGDVTYTNSAATGLPVVKEANSQYQYQINSRYEEKTRPEYWDQRNNNAGGLYYIQPSGSGSSSSSSVRSQQQQPIIGIGNPIYQLKDDSQIQVQGKSQRRTETNVIPESRLESLQSNGNLDLANQQQRQWYSEFGNGEASPDYNSYLYKRIYY